MTVMTLYKISNGCRDNNIVYYSISKLAEKCQKCQEIIFNKKGVKFK